MYDYRLVRDRTISKLILQCDMNTCLLLLTGKDIHISDTPEVCEDHIRSSLVMVGMKFNDE